MLAFSFSDCVSKLSLLCYWPPTFVTVLRIALFADARSLSLGLCLKAQSPLLLTPHFCNDRRKAKGMVFFYDGRFMSESWHCLIETFAPAHRESFDLILYFGCRVYISAGLWLLIVCFPSFVSVALRRSSLAGEACLNFGY